MCTGYRTARASRDGAVACKPGLAIGDTTDAAVTRGASSTTRSLVSILSAHKSLRDKTIDRGPNRRSTETEERRNRPLSRLVRERIERNEPNAGRIVDGYSKEREKKWYPMKTDSSGRDLGTSSSLIHPAQSFSGPTYLSCMNTRKPTRIN